MSDQKILKTVIIGSGPAGYTAAIYTARASMEPVLYTGPEPGGQLTLTTDVDNFPGYPEGRNGQEMMMDLQKQAERFDTKIVYEKITKVDFNGPVHKLWTESGNEILTHTVIIATGASAKWLGLESETRLMNVGVSACAVCDGFFYRGMDTCVIGGGDTAAEDATYLAKLCPKVHLFVRRDELRASKAMQKRVFDSKNIIVHWNTEVEEILGEKEVEAVRVFNNKTNEKTEIPIKGYFSAIGHKPNTGVFKDFLELDEVGYIKTVPGTSKTNIEGVFATGDAQDKVYRQAVTAAGSGCMGALDAERYLVEKGID